jgi:ubiquinone biosynthesis protein
MRLAQNMETCPGVSVCTTYPDYSSSRVLTMDFVRGVKISDLGAITAAGIDREVLATNALRALVKQLMIDGFFHADPHPGNILVNTETGHVTFIDTGMVGELTVPQRLNFIQLLMSLQNKDVEGAASVLKNLSVPFQDEIDDSAYTKDFRRSLGPYMIGGATLDFAQTLSTAMDVLRRNGLRLDPNLTLATKALMQTEAITSLLFPNGGLLAQGVRMAQEEAVKQINSENINKVAGKALGLAVRELSAQLPGITEAGLGWFKQFRKGRFEVYVDTSAISKEVKTLNRFGRQAVVAMMMVGLIIGSAIVTAAIGLGDFEGAFWRLLAQVAVLSYLFASVVAALIVLRLVWRWMRGADPDSD